MINVPVDEAYAYDMLSILHVKHLKARDNKDIFFNMSVFSSNISKEIGQAKHALIMQSDEYKKLIDLNARIFVLVDMVKEFETLGDAKRIDELNYQRYLVKKQLQSKYFPKSEMNEQKIGYSK